MKINKREGNLRTLFARVVCASLGFLMLTATVFAFYAALIPETVACFSGDDIPSFLGAVYEEESEEKSEAVVNLTHGQYKLFGSIPVKSVTVAKLEDTKVYVGGACPPPEELPEDRR